MGHNMKKRGMSYYAIIALILFIAGAILVLANFIPFEKILQSFTEKASCEFAIMGVHVSTKLPFSTLQDTLKKACPPKKIVFEKESAEEMNERIAKSLYDCIKLMGEGKVDLSKGGWVTGKNICFKCATVTFMDKAKESYKASKKDSTFREWLEKNELKDKQTYAQYFDNFIIENAQGKNKLALLYPPDLEPSYGYTIYMTKQVEPTSHILGEIPGISTIRKIYNKYSPAAWFTKWLIAGPNYVAAETLTEEQKADLLRPRITLIYSDFALTECKKENIVNE